MSGRSRVQPDGQVAEDSEEDRDASDSVPDDVDLTHSCTLPLVDEASKRG